MILSAVLLAGVCLVVWVANRVVDFLDGRHDERDVEVSLVFEEVFCFRPRPRLSEDRQSLFVDAIDEDGEE